MAGRPIVVMGVFVADLAFLTPKLPAWGETVLGLSFKMGPGGKGSNQAIAAARLGGTVSFISKVGRDAFGDIARRTYAEEGVDTRFLFESTEHATGGAAIIVDAVKGDNAIVVFPGACAHLALEEIDKAQPAIADAAIFMTNLELPVPVVMYGLKLARRLGVKTVLNPAPAVPVPEEIFALCDYLTPNETEAAGLTGMPVASVDDALRAGEALMARGAANVVITLGGRGALIRGEDITRHAPAVEAGDLMDSTGAGDAFCGAFAVALAEGKTLDAATRYGCTAAGIQVTRWGTAPAMPRRAEVEALTAKLNASSA
ncbi:MAG: ribokinase [Roseiarcus sp.]